MFAKRKHPSARRIWRTSASRGALLFVAGIVAATLMPTASALAGVSPHSARAASPVRVQDVRAIAKPTAVKSQVTFFSGTVAPGGSQEFVWRHTNPSLVYVPGLDPQGAATNNACQFQVTRTWYVQQPGGVTEFHFDLQNIGTLTCGTNILLSWMQASASFTTSGIGAGQTTTAQWNNIPDQVSYQVGLVPTGATSTSACRIEISNIRYSQVGAGTRNRVFDLTNIGNVDCAATVLLAQAQSIVIGTGELPAGASADYIWLNLPSGLLFFAGAEGIFDPSALFNDCELRITRTWYSQVIDPPAERQFHFTITNVGAVACNTEALLSWIS